jgi:hypothetical protein
MRRILAVASCISLAGCGFAVKHPAITAGIVGGSLGLVTCELSTEGRQKQCFEIAGGAGGLLAATVLVATWLGTVDEEPAPTTEEPLPTEPRAGGEKGGPPPAIGGTQPGLKPPPPPVDPAKPPPPPIPEYLKATTPEVYVHAGAQIVKAPAEDQAVAASFAASPTRGTLKDGQRITILTAKAKYAPNEEVRVIHILDAPDAGHPVYVMGPKPITGELVDGVEKTPAAPMPSAYDGRVVQSPAVDYNYEVTTYKFDTPGIHLIQWKANGMESNVIAVEVTKPAP